MNGPSAGIGATADRTIGRDLVSRRRWLAAVATASIPGMASALRAQTPKKKSPLTADEERVVAAVREKAKKAGLGTFEVRWTEHFVGVGDATPGRYIRRGLEICESFAQEFLAPFPPARLSTRLPARRMTVVALKDAAIVPGLQRRTAATRPSAGTTTSTRTELVIFDFRPDQAGLAGRMPSGSTRSRWSTRRRTCSVTIPGCSRPTATSRSRSAKDSPPTPNSGLRDREPTAFGRVNRSASRCLDAAVDEDRRGFRSPSCFGDDDVFDDPKTEHLAYAESWLLVHHLMRQPGSLPKFRAISPAYPSPAPRISREAYAESILGLA